MAVQPRTSAEGLVDPANWVDQFADALLGYAVTRVNPRDVAEDIVQETLLAAWKARDSFDGRSNFRTWLFAILRRKIADHFRRKGRVPGIEGAADEKRVADIFDRRGKWGRPPAKWPQQPDKIAEDSEFWLVVADCLGELPAHLAQAFHDREIAQATSEEICGVAEISPQNLAVRLHRARLLLRECLEKHWFGRPPGVANE